ncbi:hypothetical protein [Crateriforma conspicua]|uniref:Transposase IS4-like domain-containing protein n=1 Tax=Crateriforma conspicua TaxID=2527996 RepID=A0A5C5Y0Q5_9PLAN|nr:hypothetical protein [Crateriforma conspicua]TWT69187.1 hypothetical protein Pan14r_14720 [Crateriforma conspicua]
MKIGDGGTRPALNVQFASDCDARIIVGVEVSSEGTNGGRLPPMLDQFEQRYGQRPGTAIVDPAFATKAVDKETKQLRTEVISSIPRSKQLIPHGIDPHERQKGDSDEYKSFR